MDRKSSPRSRPDCRPSSRSSSWRACSEKSHDPRAPQDRHFDSRLRRRRPVRGAARAQGQSRSRRHRRDQGPARKMRLHAHGARRLQRGAQPGRLDRAPFHGHHRGRQMAAPSGARLDAGEHRGRAGARARERDRLLLRSQSRQHAARQSLRRPELRPHGAQGRSHRHRNHQPADGAGLRATDPPPGRAPRGGARSDKGWRARRRAHDRYAHLRFVAAQAVLLATGGRTSPHGGVYIKMSHLGPAKVAKEFKGMVDRCRDCGFDLAGGLVEVVPTAHYFMGGVICRADTATDWPGLFVAGEDASGMHGANRLGGNGVANSTVFGGIAGDVMPRWIVANPGHRAPDEHVLDAELARALHPFTCKAGNLNDLREKLLDTMWDEVGVVRDGAGLDRGIAALDAIEAELLATGLADDGRAFNMTWHDWLNLRSLIEVSRVIALAARERENSRGAHFRSDFPEPGDLPSSRFTVTRQTAGGLEITEQPVRFTHVKPGETLLPDKFAAE